MHFWNSTFGKVLRWIFFLPVSFLAAAILEAIPIFAYGYAANLELKFTLLTLIIGIICASLLFALIWFWFAGVCFTPMITCGLIAPTPKVASVIFGTAFVLLQGLSLLALILSERIGWGVIIYKILFSILLIAGTVATYCERESTERATANLDDVTASTRCELPAAIPLTAPRQPEMSSLPDGFEQELRERAADFVSGEFRAAGPMVQKRAARYIYDRIRLAALHHLGEHKTMDGFRDSEHMRGAAAKFRELTRGRTENA